MRLAYKYKSRVRTAWTVTLKRNAAEMKSLILLILSENSEVSVMRLMCLVSLGAAVVVAIVGLYAAKPLGDVSILCSAFLVPAFGGKVWQKSVEASEPSKK